jgi:starch phosphorylase
MSTAFIEKEYSFLKGTGVTVTIEIHGNPVHVKAFLLESKTFNTAPLFLLSTDIPENDYLARTITHHLYDANEATRIAQSIVLGTAGAKLLDALELDIDTYHMNEGHSVSLNFYLYSKYKSLEEVRKKVVFTTHTPEKAGNEEHSYNLLKEMSFFYHLQDHEVKYILGLEGENFNYTLAALKFARKANSVSKLHLETTKEMWAGHKGMCEIIAITNSQNQAYWQDKQFKEALETGDEVRIDTRKKEMKKALFKIVADQTGKLFRADVITIVWARRFAGYKRADLIMYNRVAFEALINNPEFPVQIIWAGKPYPKDEGAIATFNSII